MTTIGVVLSSFGVALTWAAVRDESVRELLAATIGGGGTIAGGGTPDSDTGSTSDAGDRRTRQTDRGDIGGTL